MTPAVRTHQLLIIDDDRTLCLAVADYFRSPSLVTHVAHSGADGLAICRQQNIDLVLLDQNLPDAEGHKLCQPILAANDRTKIIFITAYPTFDNALTAIKGGAFDYLSKPFELDELEHVIGQALRTRELEQVEQLERYRDQREAESMGLIGDSQPFQELKALAGLASSSAAPVLITGETGTGKSLLARFIHHQSSGTGAAFVSVNCAALPANLIEDELFGHEKGAYTGATATKKGVFEMAEGGTLFLDEIGEMDMALQSKLLSVLDEKQVKRLGGETSRRVEVRVIAATNARIKEAIQQQRFRGDLYYRLSVIRLHIPPLRERRQDIPLLCRYLIKQLQPAARLVLPEAELVRLQCYDWPGNVRELKNVMERAILLRQGEVITPSQLLVDPAHPELPATGPLPPPDAPLPTLEEVEHAHIRLALRRHGNNLTHTARALGISLSTLKRKVKSLLPA